MVRIRRYRSQTKVDNSPNTSTPGPSQDEREETIRRFTDIFQRFAPSTERAFEAASLEVALDAEGDAPSTEQAFEAASVEVALYAEGDIFHRTTDQEEYSRTVKIMLSAVLLELEARAQLVTAMEARLENLTLDSTQSQSETNMTNSDNWRSTLAQAGRRIVVDSIMDALCEVHPPQGQESMDELLKIAWRFEGMMFDTASHKEDYVKDVCANIRSLEIKSQATQPTAIEAMLDNLILDPGVEVSATSNINSDWRSTFSFHQRQTAVEKMMTTLERHMPKATQATILRELGLQLTTAWSVEGKIFDAATDQEDYLRQMATKMRSIETYIFPS